LFCVKYFIFCGTTVDVSLEIWLYLFIYLFKNFAAHTRYKVKGKPKNRLELHGNHRT